MKKLFILFFILFISFVVISCSSATKSEKAFKKELRTADVLPNNFLESCTNGYYQSPYEGFKIVKLKKSANGDCFMYKYYSWAYLKQENLDEYRAQTEPFGEICVYPRNLIYKVQLGAMTHSEVLNSVNCQKVLNLQTDIN